MPPVRGVRQGTVITMTTQDPRPENDRLREDQPDRERETRRDERMQREVQGVDRRGRDRIPEQYLVPDQQQRDESAGANLRDRENHPIVPRGQATAGAAGFCGAGAPSDRTRASAWPPATCHGEQKVDRRSEQRCEARCRVRPCGRSDRSTRPSVPSTAAGAPLPAARSRCRPLSRAPRATTPAVNVSRHLRSGGIETISVSARMPSTTAELRAPPPCARLLDRLRADLRDQQRLAVRRVDDKSLACRRRVVRLHRHRHGRGGLRGRPRIRRCGCLAKTRRHARRRRRRRAGCSTASTNGSDVDQPQAEGAWSQEIRLRPGDRLDGNIGRDSAPRERPRAARPIRGDGKDAGSPCRAGPDPRDRAARRRQGHRGSAAAASNNAGSLATAAAMSPSALVTSAISARDRTFDACDRLGIGGAEARTLEGDADDGRGQRADQARQIDSAKRPREGGGAHGTGWARRVRRGRRCAGAASERGRGALAAERADLAAFRHENDEILRRQVRRRREKHFLVLGALDDDLSRPVCRRLSYRRAARWRRRPRSASDRSTGDP